MERGELRAYCLSKQGAVEDFPFGDDPAVFKVMGRMFALMPLTDPLRISLKCDPTLALILRETYPVITAAWHLNKRHWNGIEIDGSIPDDEICDMVDHSYKLVVDGLTRAQQQMLNGLSGEAHG